MSGRASWRRTAFVPAALAVLAGACGLLGLIAAGDLRRAAVAVAVPLAVLGGIGALVGWWRAEREADARAALDAERIEEIEADLESQLYEKQQALQRRDKAYEAVYEWNRALRRKIVELQHARGALGDSDDVGTKILEVALNLLGAEKGLLLSREDVDHDGDLDMAVSRGFSHDPEHSRVAQRFAREVIAKDETVHEDSVPDVATPADAEIENLVAIPIYIRDKFNGALIACNKPGGFHDYEDEVLLALGDHAGAVLQNARLHGLLRGSYLTTVAMLADAVQAKDPFLRGHADEIAKLVASVADRLGLPPDARERLLFASLLRDLGKIGISERILLKPAALAAEERDVVEMHPRIGTRLVEKVPALREMAPAILHHHERWDGDGYPERLAADGIPLEARIIAVADAFDAMTSDRPYRAKISAEEACRELERSAGTQFDPHVVRAFCSEVRRRPGTAREVEREESIRNGDLAVGEPVLGFGSFSLVDNLTLLYSHRHLHDVARAEALRARDHRRPFALVLAKLTDIERINREQSYADGDRAIQHVARVVEAMAARCGGTAARHGGACIGLLVPGANEAIAETLVAELRRDLADAPAVETVAVVCRDGESGEDVIQRAARSLAAATRA